MRIAREPRWSLTVSEAIDLQKRMASCLSLRGGPRNARLVAGADVAYDPSVQRCFAAVVVLERPHLEVVEEVTADATVSFPYVPGLLSFREGPVIVEAFSKLKVRPQVVFFDAHGYAHPRRFGLACHIGYLLDIPSVGCAKSVLVGEPQRALPEKALSWVWLIDKGERVGAVLRTQTGRRPIYVSPGYRVGFLAAIRLVSEVLGKFRVPEPTRLADILVERHKRKYLQQRGVRERLTS